MTNYASRREVLTNAACGFGSLALAGLCARPATAATSSPLAAQSPQFPSRAKRLIFIFMQGGPSQVDTYDPKSLLDERDGEEIEFYNSRNRVVQKQRVQKSPWKFARHGECGQPVSELFPHMAKHVDDYCVVRSMHTEGVAHGPSTLFLHTGATNLIRPSMGAWLSYGLGTENENLPAFVTLHPPMSKGGPRNYSNAFLPTIHQGTAIGRAATPVGKASIRHIQNTSLTLDEQQRQFEYLSKLNREQAGSQPDDELDAAIQSYELAWRMQMHAPEALDISRETKETQQRYGIGAGPTDDFGRMCLLGRRLSEAGVRFVQINYSDNGATPRWDQHSNLKQHETHALATDQPVAALLSDLKERGLLEDTIVWWGGEFGRTPFAQGKDGRDHNPNGFSIWLAGGGFKSGTAYGETDEFGYFAVQNKIHMHDLHATLLHALGIDHERLTYRYAGRDFRLTDVHGRVVHDLFA
ncbi:DUF1501 domain-containing protein [bacterium]|nr:DUF1501 domain-containing protein [bacterium]